MPSHNHRAWGQFLDYARSTGQIGVYGTATAVKTLALIGEADASDYITCGTKWLLDSFDNHESLASKKKDWGVVYKYCYFLESLAPNDPEVNTDSPIAEHFRTLIDNRLPDDGWGEYYYSTENKDSSHSVVATAMALYVLRRYTPFSKGQQGKQASSWFCDKLVKAAAANRVELALSIIALRDYSQAHNDLAEAFSQLADRLGSNIRKLGRVSDLSEFVHHFTVPSKNSGETRNRYVFLPTNAVVAYSLLITGQYRTARDYIDETVAMYQKSIAAHGAYCNPEQSPRQSTVNQFWVALLLKEYGKLTPAGRLESAYVKLRSRSWLYKIVLVGITAIMFAVVYALIGHFQQNQNLSFISFSLFFVVNWVLSRIWKTDR